MEETRVIYHLEDQHTPYLVRIGVPAQRVTLLDVKNALNKPHARFFFRSEDRDFGVVKEEISDDGAVLPCANGRIVCWLVSADSQLDFRGSDVMSVATPTSSTAPPFRLTPPPSDRAPPPPDKAPPPERTRGIGDSRPPSFHALQEDSEGHAHLHKPSNRHRAHRGSSSNQQQSSELETTSFCSSGDSGGRFSQSEQSSSSPRLFRRQRRRHRKKPTQPMDKSLSSVTDSTMSLNITTVTLNMEQHHFLGVSVLGQSTDRGDGGIYIGSIMKGGAVEADGRIEPGDMLLQVNDINFENMSNDDAVKVLRDVLHTPGPVTLTVAKCWDPSPRSCFTLPPSEPVRPIDPAAWVCHTAAMTGRLTPHYSVHEETPLSVHSDITAVVAAMANHRSGLEVRDRLWLKITIPNAFIGSDVVDWLLLHVEGFCDRREARKYASNLLQSGFIRHTVSKVSFSEQCYYSFGDVCTELGLLTVEDPEESRVSEPESCAVPHPYSAPHRLQPNRDAGSHHSHGSGGGSNCSEKHRDEVDQSELRAAQTPPPASRQSFRLAVGNPSEFFVDVM
ncbi:segment polarity protein dishevelled homolog DVL-3-like [Boleophthalmus pectinirostris]|uniref:segment polarity protein dishevelled homolog DVL-3-like n=1 Tax=Boleophthalmus pectinirostris TaxID=150288 RepID=UPI00242D907F|nr:segment polarity protein dishevelled homolog DVL-3-like [Boleophthalmus pectinirostris]